VNVGGHAGYSIRPSARPITCDDDNVRSARVIEVNVGPLEAFDILLRTQPVLDPARVRLHKHQPLGCAFRGNAF